MTMAVELARTDTTTASKDGSELVIERVFDAPRELVWNVLTDPKRVPHWWGPRRYTTIVLEMDFRPGGKWRFINRADDGGEHPFKGEYLEIVPPERIVQTFIYDVPPFQDLAAIETMTLEAQGGKTKATVRSRYPSPEVLDGALSTGMVEGAIETWDRLAEEIAKG
jgi:uncharacterized protein YndB with AHSA1/START domain